MEIKNENIKLLKKTFTYEGIDIEDVFPEYKFIIEEFICTICNGLVINPINCEYCGNCFCEICINKWLNNNSKCPNMCSMFKSSKLGRIAQNILNKVKLNCLYRSNGCFAEIEYENYMKHCENCKYVQFECLYDNCGYIGPKYKLEEHFGNCHRPIILCRNCNISLTIVEYNSHFLNCYRKSEEIYQENLKMLVEENLKLKVEINKLNEENNNLKCTLEKSKKCMNSNNNFDLLNSINTQKDEEKLKIDNKEYLFMKSDCNIFYSRYLFNITTLSFPKSLSQYRSSITCIVSLFAYDSEIVAVGSKDNSITIWDLKNRNSLFTFENCHQDTVKSIIYPYEHSNKYIISSGGDNIIRLWNFEERIHIANFQAHKDQILKISYLKNDKFASCGGDYNIFIWNIDNIQKIFCVLTSDKGIILDFINFTYQNETYLIAQVNAFEDEGDIFIWNIDKNTLSNRLSLIYTVNLMEYIENTVYVLCSYDTTISIWDIITGKEIQKYKDHTSCITAIAYMCIDFEFKKEYFILIGTEEPDCSIKLYSLSSAIALNTLYGHKKGINKIIDFSNLKSPQKGVILSSGNDGMIIAWNVFKDNPIIQQINCFTVRITHINIVNNKYVIICASDGSLQFYSLNYDEVLNF